MSRKKRTKTGCYRPEAGRYIRSLPSSTWSLWWGAGQLHCPSRPSKLWEAPVLDILFVVSVDVGLQILVLVDCILGRLSITWQIIWIQRALCLVRPSKLQPESRQIEKCGKRKAFGVLYLLAEVSHGCASSDSSAIAIRKRKRRDALSGRRWTEISSKLILKLMRLTGKTSY